MNMEVEKKVSKREYFQYLAVNTRNSDFFFFFNLVKMGEKSKLKENRLRNYSERV